MQLIAANSISLERFNLKINIFNFLQYQIAHIKINVIQKNRLTSKFLTGIIKLINRKRKYKSIILRKLKKQEENDLRSKVKWKFTKNIEWVKNTGWNCIQSLSSSKLLRHKLLREQNLKHAPVRI